MAGDYNYNQALQQCNKITSVYDDCDAAKQELPKVKQGIVESWTGQSGAAMIESIEIWETNLSIIMTRLYSLETRMRQAAWNYQQIANATE